MNNALENNKTINMKKEKKDHLRVIKIIIIEKNLNNYTLVFIYYLLQLLIYIYYKTMINHYSFT